MIVKKLDGRDNENMKDLSDYIAEYSESHRNPVNIKVHNVCVPLIMWSLLAGLHPLKITEYNGHELRASYVIVALALLYYLQFKNLKVFVAMLLTSALMLATVSFFTSTVTLLWTAGAVFVAAWVGQFYGHHIEGKKPSFMKDIQFLLIGPVWVLYKQSPEFFGLKRHQ